MPAAGLRAEPSPRGRPGQTPSRSGCIDALATGFAPFADRASAQHPAHPVGDRDSAGWLVAGGCRPVVAENGRPAPFAPLVPQGGRLALLGRPVSCHALGGRLPLVKLGDRDQVTPGDPLVARLAPRPAVARRPSATRLLTQASGHLPSPAILPAALRARILAPCPRPVTRTGPWLALFQAYPN